MDNKAKLLETKEQPKMTPEKLEGINSFMKEMDVNSDGKITREEFIKYVFLDVFFGQIPKFQERSGGFVL